MRNSCIPGKHQARCRRQMSPKWKQGPRWTYIGPGSKVSETLKKKGGPNWKYVGPKKKAPKANDWEKARANKGKLNATRIKAAFKIINSRRATLRTSRKRAKETVRGLLGSDAISSDEESDDTDTKAAQSDTSTSTDTDSKPERDTESDTDVSSGVQTIMDLIKPHNTSTKQYQRFMGVIRYHPAHPSRPKMVLVRKNEYLNPMQDTTEIHTLKEKAVFTVAINLQNKEGLATLQIPDREKIQIRCYHHFCFPHQYSGPTTTVYNTGRCEACCMAGCKTCCRRWAGTFPGLPAPPAAAQGYNS